MRTTVKTTNKPASRKNCRDFSREKLLHVTDFFVASAPRCDTAGHIGKADALYIGHKTRKVYALCPSCIRKLVDGKGIV